MVSCLISWLFRFLTWLFCSQRVNHPNDLVMAFSHEKRWTKCSPGSYGRSQAQKDVHWFYKSFMNKSFQYRLFLCPSPSLSSCRLLHHLSPSLSISSLNILPPYISSPSAFPPFTLSHPLPLLSHSCLLYSIALLRLLSFPFYMTPLDPSFSLPLSSGFLCAYVNMYICKWSIFAGVYLYVKMVIAVRICIICVVLDYDDVGICKEIEL